MYATAPQFHKVKIFLHSYSFYYKYKILSHIRARAGSHRIKKTIENTHSKYIFNKKSNFPLIFYHILIKTQIKLNNIKLIWE
ncbi:hypothetical protein B5S50_17415 [Clostridium sp. 001]|nr:hypothetical protein B5S50_17415 [Clostridium sp. 001]